MIRHFKYQIIVFVFLILPHLTAQVKFDYISNVGLISLQEDGTACLIIRNPNLDAGIKFVIVSPFVQEIATRPQLMSGEVIGHRKGICTLPASSEYGDSSYIIKITQGTLLKNNPYFAVFIPPQILKIKDNDVIGDLDGDGTLEYFRQCTSSEGVHLTIWSGEPLKGTRRWHHYYYLGYDVEPSCNEADYSEH